VAFRELGSVRRVFWAATAAGTTALGLRLAGAVGLCGGAGGGAGGVLR
jgi:hypothetical protein